MASPIARFLTGSLPAASGVGASSWTRARHHTCSSYPFPVLDPSYHPLGRGDDPDLPDAPVVLLNRRAAARQNPGRMPWFSGAREQM